MIPIMLKDLRLTWLTFRKFIVVGAALFVVGMIGLIAFGSTQSVEDGNPTAKWHQLGVIRDGIPSELIEHLESTETIKVVQYESIEALGDDVRDKELRYGLYQADDDTLALGVSSASDIGRLFQRGVLEAYFKDVSLPLEFVTFTEDRSERFQTYLIWFAFIGLLAIGNSLCNILVWEERVKGNLEELVAAPVTRLEILLGKLFAVLISAAGICCVVVFGLLAAFVVLATIVIMNSSSLLQSFVAGIGEQSVRGEPTNAVDVAGVFVNTADPALVGVVILACFAALLALTAALVVINFVVKQQATLRFVVTPGILLVYGIPWFVGFDVVSQADWHWVVPVANIYFTSAYSAMNGMSAAVWLPALGVNISAFMLVLLGGVYAISRIQDWPSR